MRHEQQLNRLRVGRRPQGLLAKRRGSPGHAPNVRQTAGGGTGVCVDGPHRRWVYEQMQAVADRYLAMGSARIYHNDAARQATCAAADCYRMCCDFRRVPVAASTAALVACHQRHGGVGHGLCESGERRVGRLEADDGGRAGTGLCGIKFYGARRAESSQSSSTPSTRRLLDGVTAMSGVVPHRSTEPARPRHRREMT